MEKKLAIVCSGGGMTCSYTAGFLSALVKEYGLKQPEIVIAGSGSAGTTSYYVAKQYDSMTNIWANRLSTKKFIDLLRIERIIDIDYVIDRVFKEQEPLDIAEVVDSDIHYIVPALNIESGVVEYFSNKDDVDWFEVLRATKAMPILFNKCVGINGHQYCDSRVSSGEGLNILKALEIGATHILVVATDEHENMFEEIGYDLWLDSKSDEFRSNHKKLEEIIASTVLPESIKFLKIAPKEKLPVKVLDNGQDHLRESIKLGYHDCKNDPQIKQFIDNYRS